MEDLSLVEDILKGNPESFNALIYKYEYHVYSFVLKNVNNPETARDITQEVFIAVYNKLYTYKREYKFSNWLFQIARNKCADYGRRNKKYMEVDLEAAGDILSRDMTPEEHLELGETKRVFKSFLQGLDFNDRQILILRYLRDNMTFEDIGDILNMKSATVKTKYYRTLDKLRLLLKEEKRGC